MHQPHQHQGHPFSYPQENENLTMMIWAASRTSFEFRCSNDNKSEMKTGSDDCRSKTTRNGADNKRETKRGSDEFKSKKTRNGAGRRRKGVGNKTGRTTDKDSKKKCAAESSDAIMNRLVMAMMMTVVPRATKGSSKDDQPLDDQVAE